MNIHSHYLTTASSTCILLHCQLVEKVVRAFFSQSQQTQTIRGENDCIYLTQRAREIVRGGYHWILPYLDLIGRSGSTRFFN